MKNILIFLPLIFSQNLFSPRPLARALFAFFAFCLTASSIYIFNDIRDVEADRHHEVKRNRPIASGAVSVPAALSIFFALLAAALFIMLFWLRDIVPLSLLVLYFALNVAYSLGLKRIPLVDIVILVSGFLIRVVIGAVVINQPISSWLYLTVISVAFYLGLGKRRNELKKTGDDSSSVRGVLKYYNESFLGKNMYVCLTLTIVFYSLWTVESPSIHYLAFGGLLIWTVPLVLLICMRYSLCVESEAYADPVDVLLGSPSLIALVLLYLVFMFMIFYGLSFIRGGG
jgi:4-hydroxybenzoate polyprenyltransferase